MKSTKSAKTLIFFLDALRPDNIGQGTPFMQEIKKKHTFLPLISLLGYSSGIHPTIWTGTWQEQHGKFLVYEYNPKASKFKWFRHFSIVPAKLRSFIFAGFKVPYYYAPWFRKYLPKFYHDRFLQLPPTIEPALAPYFAVDTARFKGHSMLDDIEKKHQIRFMSDHKNPPIFPDACPVDDWELSDKDIDFFFTYDTDGFGHSYGPKSKEMARLLAKIDKSMARLYREAGKKYDKVNLFVFSDHGMCEVKKFCDVQKHLAKLKYKCPEDYLVFFDATMVRFWTKNSAVKKALIGVVKKIPELTYIDKRLKDKYHINFKNRRFGDIMCTVAPETRIFPDYFAPVKAAIKGLHGYDPWFKHSKGIFLSNCIETAEKEIRVIDVLPTIMSVLSVKPPKGIHGKSINRKH
ncbi:alkaline phosphatase family protein [Nanoarchaeota archaeon]